MKYVLFASFDTGWIVRTGQYIIKALGVPYTDLFSWTHQERAFVAYQWLSELAVAYLYSLGGLWNVGFFFALMAGFIYLFFLPILWIRLGLPPALPYLLLMLVLSPHWFNVRPQMFSYFFLLLFIYILENYRSKRDGTRLWLLVLASAVWANIHLFWSIGLMLITVYLACDQYRLRQSRLSPLLLVLPLSALAILLNPYGANLYCYLWSFVNKSQFMGMDEVLPLWTMPTAGYTLAFFAIGWQALVSRRKSLPAESFLVCAGATIASVLVRRYGSLSVILLWPYFGLAFSQINWQRYTWLPKLSQLHVAILAAASLLISGVMWYTGCSSETSAKNLYTEGSFRSLLLVNAYLNGKDRIFNDPLTGDWLILCTDVPVYVDTRYDMYPKIFCEDAYACLWGAAGTLDYMKGHGVTHILVMDGFPPINKLLDQSSDWTLIIDDGRVSFWGRNSPEEVKRMAGMQLTDCQIGASRLPLELIKKTVGRRAQAVAAQAKTSSRPKP